MTPEAVLGYNLGIQKQLPEEPAEKSKTGCSREVGLAVGREV